MPSDASSRARALDRALVLKDEAEARLFFRYHSESRSTFHRAYKELVATLERDAAGLVDGDEAGSPNEPDAPGEGPETAGEVDAPRAPEVAREGSVSPNEPDAPESPNEPSIQAEASTEPREEAKTSGEKPVHPEVAPVADRRGGGGGRLAVCRAGARGPRALSDAPRPVDDGWSARLELIGPAGPRRRHRPAL